MKEARDQRRLSRRDVVLGAATAGGVAALGGSMLSAQAAAAAPAPMAAVVPVINSVHGPGWLNTLLEVENIAGKILPMILRAQNGEVPPPFRIGDVQFRVEGMGKVMAYNISEDVRVGLCYSATRSAPDTNVSEYYLVPPGLGVSCLGPVNDFIDGQVFLASAPDLTATDGTITRTVSFAVRALPIGSRIMVIRDLWLEVQKDPTTGAFSLLIVLESDIRLMSASILTKGPGGASGRAEWANEMPVPGPSTIIVPLPEGVNLDSVVRAMEVYLEIDAAQLDQLIAASPRSR